MRIIIVSAVFPPEPIVSARTSFDIASALHSNSHEVHVITNFPNRPAGELVLGYRRRLFPKSEMMDGIKVIRCYSAFSKSSTIISRFLENLTFGLTSSLVLFFSKKPDLIFSNSWPIFATGLIALVCKLRKIPLVLSVQDIYPETISYQGRIQKENNIYKYLLLIDKLILKLAVGIIVLSEKFANHLIKSRNVNPNKMFVIPNWIDENSISLMEPHPFRSKIGVSADAFLLFYGGNISKSANVEQVINALKLVKSERELVFVIAGSGGELNNCKKLASNVKKNARIIFHNPWKAEETSEALAAADLCILPTNGNQSLTSVPSKMLTYMLAGKPILAIVSLESDSADLINISDCGWVTPTGNLFSLIKILEDIIDKPLGVLKQKGQSGRAFTLANFGKKNKLIQIEQIINSLIPNENNENS